MQKINTFRRKKGITQKDLAEALGWSVRRISNYEQGIRTPNIKDCQQIVKGLNQLGVKCGLDDVFPLESAA